MTRIKCNMSLYFHKVKQLCLYTYKQCYSGIWKPYLPSEYFATCALIVMSTTCPNDWHKVQLKEFFAFQMVFTSWNLFCRAFGFRYLSGTCCTWLTKIDWVVRCICSWYVLYRCKCHQYHSTNQWIMHSFRDTSINSTICMYSPIRQM